MTGDTADLLLSVCVSGPAEASGCCCTDDTQCSRWIAVFPLRDRRESSLTRSSRVLHWIRVLLQRRGRRPPVDGHPVCPSTVTLAITGLPIQENVAWIAGCEPRSTGYLFHDSLDTFTVRRPQSSDDLVLDRYCVVGDTDRLRHGSPLGRGGAGPEPEPGPRAKDRLRVPDGPGTVHRHGPDHPAGSDPRQALDPRAGRGKRADGRSHASPVHSGPRNTNGSAGSNRSLTSPT